MTSPRSIVVLGSANVDWMLALPRLPQAGETVAGHGLRTAVGGKGANQAVAAARLGAAVTFIGCVGDDAPGEAVVRALQAEGVDLRCLQRAAGVSTGMAVVLTDAAGDNCIALVAGANALLSPEHVAACRQAIEGASLLVCQLETPLNTVGAAVDMAHAAGVLVLLNPAPAQPLDPALLSKLRFLVPNESEASALSAVTIVDDRSAEAAAQVLLQRGAETVVITRGERGVLLAERDRLVHLPARLVAVVDTTGAGDTFVGAYATAWIEGQTVLAAIDFAQRAASLGVQGRGAQAPMPTRAQVDGPVPGHLPDPVVRS